MSGPGVAEVAADLAAETDALDEVLTMLTDEQWGLATPSPGWTIADQIGHLTYYDDAARQAIEDPDTFTADRDAFFDAIVNGGASADDLTLGEFRAHGPTEQLALWRDGRRRLQDAAATLTDDQRVEWYGPSMSARSFLTARLMEAWAHGQDVVDTARAAGIDAHRPATDRLRHIAQLGVITRAWSYRNRRLDVPEGEVRVELDAPDGGMWTWGPEDARDVVRGSAEDFCLVVTQRRHVDDTALEVVGPLAADWMARAQAFAGPPTDGPSPAHVD